MIDEVIAAARSKLALPETVDVTRYRSIVELFDDCCDRYGSSKSFTSLGKTLTYQELRAYADNFASYIQHHTELQPGDCIAIQLPNIIQFPVALFGALKAGLIVVNTNPLYSKVEIEHQFNDAGVKGLVVLANVAANVQSVVKDLELKTVIVTEVADLDNFVRRNIINFVVRKIKKGVPPFSIPQKTSFREVLALGGQSSPTVVERNPQDLAVLQYTGGTTGVAKGAMLSHGNIIANTLQSAAIFSTYDFDDKSETFIAPLPLYHIYAFTVTLVMLTKGAHSVLIPNPRDLDSMVKAMQAQPFSALCGLNTLFVALTNHTGFQQLDFSHLKMTLSGGMALTQDAAKEWQQLTKSPVFEGYGLTEASPVVTVNPGGGNQIGTIGLPLPSTSVRILGEDGVDQGVDQPGELLVKGPQVMMGYWQRPDATQEVMSGDWLHTGDIAVVQPDGYLKIVDRKKDMIIVSGFNVYPNEVENVVVEHPLVLECAVVGVPSKSRGEAVKLFVVAKDPSLTEEMLLVHCRQSLAAYKVPDYVEFRDSLPKSHVGKVLRKELKAD